MSETDDGFEGAAPLRARYDVLVAGAGPAGAIAARQLALAGAEVLWIDRTQPSGRRIGEALIPAATALLRDLRLHHVLVNGPHVQCPGNVTAWAEERATATDFLRDPHGPGHHLDRFRFDEALRQAARDANVPLRLVRSYQVEREASRDSRAGEGGFLVATETGRTRCRSLVDATGRASALARRLGARRARDAELLAVYGWLGGGDAQERRTWIEAAPEGWWYTALLPDGSRSVALHTERTSAQHLTRSPLRWDQLLRQTRHLSRWLQEGERDGQLYATDASGAVLEPVCGRGWIAVGDAALSFEPLSGQGLFTALYTGLRGAEAVVRALGGDPGSLAAYGERVLEIRRVYLRNLSQAYLTQRRFSDSPFWRSRRELLTVNAAG